MENSTCGKFNFQKQCITLGCSETVTMTLMAASLQVTVDSWRSVTWQSAIPPVKWWALCRQTISQAAGKFHVSVTWQVNFNFIVSIKVNAGDISRCFLATPVADPANETTDDIWTGQRFQQWLVNGGSFLSHLLLSVCTHSFSLLLSCSPFYLSL